MKHSNQEAVLVKKKASMHRMKFLLATHKYTKNPSGPVGNELDLMEGDTLVYLMEHDDNESWWLAEDVKGQLDMSQRHIS